MLDRINVPRRALALLLTLSLVLSLGLTAAATNHFVDYSPYGLDLTAMEGYTKPVTGTIDVSVDPATDFTITRVGVNEDEWSSDEGLEDYVSCVIDVHRLHIAVKPGLPAGRYHWMLTPKVTAGGEALNAGEFTVFFEVEELDPNDIVAEYSPNGMGFRAVEGYDLPLTGSIDVSVDPDVAFEIASAGVEDTTWDPEFSAADYLTCTVDGDRLILNVLPGLPAGYYSWFIWPEVTCGGELVNAAEFTVTCEVAARDASLVYYDGNGGTDAPPPTAVTEAVTASAPYRSNASCTLDGNGGVFQLYTTVGTTPTLARSTSWVFDGWNTARDGSGTAYAAGASAAGLGGKILYAQWKGPVLQFWDEPERDGYSFLGFYSAKTGGTKLTATTPVPEDSVWYARWKKTGGPTITGQPQSQTVEKGSKAAFTVKATGDGLTYQWY